MTVINSYQYLSHHPELPTKGKSEVADTENNSNKADPTTRSMDSVKLSVKSDSAKAYLKSKYPNATYANKSSEACKTQWSNENRPLNDMFPNPGSIAIFVDPVTQKKMDQDPEYAMQIAKKIENYFEKTKAENDAIIPRFSEVMSMAVSIDENGEIGYWVGECNTRVPGYDGYEVTVVLENGKERTISGLSEKANEKNETVKAPQEQIPPMANESELPQVTREATKVRTFNGDIIDLNTGLIVSKGIQHE